MEGFKHDSLQALSDRLQQLSDISSRFDALTKETEEKLHNVIETANVLQQKMTPINKEIEVLRDKKKGYESCRQFLKQTSSYQVTTEKYIQEIQQSKINDVEEYVNLLTKAKESLDFFSTYLPGEKNAENLHYIISEGSKGLRDKFKEQLTSVTQTDRMQPERCLTLSGIQPVDLQTFLPKFNEKQLQELRLIANWLDSQGKTSEYVQIYIEVRSLSLCSTLKKFRDSLLGIGNNTFGTSPSLPRRGGPRDTPSKPALQRRIRSKPMALGQPPSALTGISGLDTSDQPELDSEDVNAMMTAFLRLAMIEALILPKFSLKLDKSPLLLVDLIVAKAKETLFEDVHVFAAAAAQQQHVDGGSRKLRQQHSCSLTLRGSESGFCQARSKAAAYDLAAQRLLAKAYPMASSFYSILKLVGPMSHTGVKTNFSEVQQQLKSSDRGELKKGLLDMLRRKLRELSRNWVDSGPQFKGKFYDSVDVMPRIVPHPDAALPTFSLATTCGGCVGGSADASSAADASAAKSADSSQADPEVDANMRADGDDTTVAEDTTRAAVDAADVA